MAKEQPDDQLQEMVECQCHKETGTNHEQCCGYTDGRNPNCFFHGDGTTQ